MPKKPSANIKCPHCRNVIGKAPHMDIVGSWVQSKYPQYPCPVCGVPIDVAKVNDGEYDYETPLIKKFFSCLGIVITLVLLIAFLGALGQCGK